MEETKKSFSVPDFLKNKTLLYFKLNKHFYSSVLDMIVDRKLSIRNCKRKDPCVELGEVTPSLARGQLFSPTFNYVFKHHLN